VSSVTGAICLDILKDQWSPALTMKTAMLSLQALMCSPEPNDPQDAVVATMYKERQAEYVSTAKYVCFIFYCCKAWLCAIVIWGLFLCVDTGQSRMPSPAPKEHR